MKPAVRILAICKKYLCDAMHSAIKMLAHQDIGPTALKACSTPLHISTPVCWALQHDSMENRATPHKQRPCLSAGALFAACCLLSVASALVPDVLLLFCAGLLILQMLSATLFYHCTGLTSIGK
jgi:hypothetical protein